MTIVSGKIKRLDKISLYDILLYTNQKARSFGKESAMANEEFMEEMENEGTLITLEDEEGNEIEFEFLDVVEYEGEEYIVLIENDEEADEVVILKINAIDDETEEYASIEDEELLEKLFEIFKSKYEGDIDFA